MSRSIAFPLKKTLIVSTAILSLTTLIALPQNAYAADFTVPENGTITGGQTLNSDETGLIGTGGLL